ncbi:hypothetical protein BDE36_3920 [Arcticibacter tournemirensis]|uniref:Uncharacterized protein n=1 Tax=Arcticibacter tournemirensis TaxID=699437 RepID=A0A4Q0MCZ1_9SPHI|nr:hypothetical protein [Arcticibacter tournemirensis]KAA8486307.1 hypothetical protein F1649_01620 [Arcticibacter tournemirensis]RXF71075.1 hypothetical protein EKH83_05075 [Arcticibacter tournemirensis]TQM52118.1 hypothetical protein BDE36_3920 [Arcticibacter tournemirensis]
MPLSYTQYTLDKLELLLKALDYKVRYEKGNFKTAACLLENSKVVVVNKFSSLESKINSLAELLQQIPISENLLDEKQKQFLYHLKQTSLQL